jgi:hypothetical protein
MTYLKVLLTIIAVCQVYNVAKDAISPAQAQTRMDVNIAAVGGVFPGAGIPVRVLH